MKNLILRFINFIKQLFIRKKEHIRDDSKKLYEIRLEDVNEPCSMIVYTDGSYDSLNHKNNMSGGMHSYIFKQSKIGNVTNKRPEGHFITNQGYIDSKTFKQSSFYKLVKPIAYIDATYSIRDIHDITAIEMLAVSLSLEDIYQKVLPKINLKHITLLIDSQRVVDAVSNLINGLEDNHKQFPRLKKIYDKFKKKDILIGCIKVKAHVNNIGNNLTDGLAKFRSKPGHLLFVHTDVNSYWVKPSSYIPAIYNFNHMVCDPIRYKIRGKVSFMVVDEYNRMMGTVRMVEHQPMLNSIMSRYTTRSKNILTSGKFFSMEIPKVFNIVNIRYFKLLGQYVFKYHYYNDTITDMVGENVLSALTNERLTRQMDVMHRRQMRILGDYIDNTLDDYYCYDVTDRFYTIQDNKKGIEVYLSNIDNNRRDIKVLLKEEQVIRLVLGDDIPDYHFFKSIEKDKPKITVIINKKFRQFYYLVVETMDGNAAIFCNISGSYV